jgi:PKHD-type hydroxylase
MLIHIPDVLSADRWRMRAACSFRRLGGWPRDGRSAVGACQGQRAAARGHPAARELGDTIVSALQRHPLFISAALPLHVFPPLFNRYAGGQSFGHHIDNAIRQMPGMPHRIRTDLSCTLFLSGRDEYDGGELMVEDTYGLHSVKLPAGHLVLYPATSLHHVRPVTRGVRCSFFWLQGGAQRRRPPLLFVSTRRSATCTASRPRRRRPLTGVYHSLLRRWASQRPALSAGGPRQRPRLAHEVAGRRRRPARRRVVPGVRRELVGDASSAST